MSDLQFTRPTRSSLVDGEELVVDTEQMDEVTIDLQASVAVRGRQLIQVELFDGRREIGTVIFDEAGVSITGQDTLTVDPDDVFAMTEVNKTFWEALSVYLAARAIERMDRARCPMQ